MARLTELGVYASVADTNSGSFEVALARWFGIDARPITGVHVDGAYIASGNEAECLALLSKCRRLKVAAIVGWQCFGDDDLVRQRNFRRVHTLTLRQTAITDDSAHVLRKYPRLYGLDVDNSNVTDRFLEEMTTASRLGWISVEGTNITKAGVAHFRASRPDVQVSPR